MPVNEYIFVTFRECGEKFFQDDSALLMEEIVVCPGCRSRNIEKERTVVNDLAGELKGRDEEVNNGYV